MRVTVGDAFGAAITAAIAGRLTAQAALDQAQTFIEQLHSA